MIRVHHIPEKDILLHCRSSQEANDYVRKLVGLEPTSIYHDKCNRVFVVEVEDFDIVESTAKTIGMLLGTAPIHTRRRVRRHPKEGTWPNDVEFKEPS